MRRSIRFVIALGVIAVVVVAALGCATITKEEDPKESLKKAAERYWKLRMEDRYEDAYKIEAPEGLPPYDAYRTQASAIKKIRIISITVGEAGVDGDKGDIETEWTFTLPNIPGQPKQVIKDQWVRLKGEWRHIFKTR